MNLKRGQKFNRPVLNKVVKFWKYIIFAEN